MSTLPLLPAELWNERLFTGDWQLGPLPATVVVEPASGAPLGSIGNADAALVALSSQTASQAQKQWYALPHSERAQVFRRAAQACETHHDEIVDWLIRESGSTRPKAMFEVNQMLQILNESAALPSRSQGEVLPSTPGRLSLARRKPLGVIGVISPFNYPLCLAIRAVAPALAVGNAVILKPDPRTSISGGFVIARIFELAGLPKGLLHVLPGSAEAGAALTTDPHIAMIQFTGSTGAGRKIAEAAGRHLKKVSLELGGKNSLIILDDADLDLAVSNATWGTYLHQGQVCVAIGRILVHRSLYPAFLARLVAKAKSLTVGDPAKGDYALGPLINAQQRDHVDRLVKAAEQAGARIEAGGNYEGLFYQPTVLSGVDERNPIFKEEVFGPVAVVMPFDSDEDAVRLANNTEFGLAGAVISNDVGRALNLGEQLHVGLLHINDQTVVDEVINPFGGVGASGNGSSIGGPANWEEFTQWQWITLKSEAPRYPM
ncbi:benzaldehyde dehydrogenase [Pseudomonas agarici]|uniref:Benzaldehyde dehydrogenase n=1 Tax=Pseudomonas agarici TaxID=46677 RepID=A0A0X1SZE4_PSEAA|nr:benzaldehyde dehydrogenase [Pseudomonas agarici]AMB85177.1 benzaldehyde dehydrogenase [Pseudomonas agarici]NWB94137.1 benzaldehyde dehydrogenase [Pseudomonas agarici]NWC07939.1 benzaldehyde dehydrogenase [Pseudomonas agarici]SEK78429.1 benzaldehyde dehydrogenase (NAD+) [Pseudomonas agarici]